MICPKCKAEYVPGIAVCADCNVPLVDNLPEESSVDSAQESGARGKGFREILIALNATDVALIKSILDGAGIDYYIKSDHFTFGRPFEDPSRLYIRDDQLDEALDILKDFGLEGWGNLRSDEEEEGG
jgi:hypothetical protein